MARDIVRTGLGGGAVRMALGGGGGEPCGRYDFFK